MLTDDEKQLREDYEKILRLCNSEKAISMGRFFDVTYVNYNNPKFNPHRHYAFLRNYDDVTLVIAVSFDKKPADVEINIPQHAFNLLEIPQGNVSATELLTGITEEKTLSSDSPFKVHLAAPYRVAIWKIKHKDVISRLQKRKSVKNSN